MIRTKSRFTPWLYVLPAIAVFIATVILPIAWSLRFSFYRWDGLGPKVFVGFDNFAQLFQDAVFTKSFTNNLFFTGVGTATQVLVGLGLAVLLLSIQRFRNIIKVAYFIPSIISSVAISQIFAQLLSVSPPGVINATLTGIGLSPHPFLSDPNLTLLIVTLVDAYKFAALYMVIYYSALIAIDPEVLDSAAVDGCNWWQQYVYIKFPLIKAVIVITVVMLVSGTLKGFDVPYILTNGGPGTSSEMVATYMYKTIFNSNNFGYGSAIGVFLVAESLIIVAVLRRMFRPEVES